MGVLCVQFWGSSSLGTAEDFSRRLPSDMPRCPGKLPPKTVPPIPHVDDRSKQVIEQLVMGVRKGPDAPGTAAMLAQSRWGALGGPSMHSITSLLQSQGLGCLDLSSLIEKKKKEEKIEIGDNLA